METTNIRFKTGIVGYTAPYGTPSARPFGYESGDEAAIETGQASRWLENGVAERVETATREPQAERAMRVLRRRRRR